MDLGNDTNNSFRKNNWNHSDWLPILSASHIRKSAHRAFPKKQRIGILQE